MSLSLAVFFGGIVAALLFDAWTLWKQGVSSTISVQLYQFSKANPLIPVLLGILIGHLFWPNPGGCK